MSYTVDEMARALARREVLRAIVEKGVLIFDLSEVEQCVTILMQQQNFYAKARVYINEWARLDAMEATNVVRLR